MKGSTLVGYWCWKKRRKFFYVSDVNVVGGLVGWFLVSEEEKKVVLSGGILVVGVGKRELLHVSDLNEAEW